jgi:formylglycine-generating enzyme required for sulfatase activity
MRTTAAISRAFASALFHRWPAILLPLPFCILYTFCPTVSWTQTLPAKSGSTFSDGAGLPEMVVIPPGTLAIGADAADELRWHQRSTPPDPPPHEISFPQPFAISKYPVTTRQWDACVSSGGCTTITPQWPVDPQAGPDDPLTHVSFLDAQSYVAWLNSLTVKAGKGAPYTLPSEAQWEYAATAAAPWTNPAAYTAWLAKLPAPNPHPDDRDWPYILLSGLSPAAWQSFMYANASNGFFPFTGLYYDMWFSRHGVQKMPGNGFGVAGMLAPDAEWTADCWSTDFTKPPPAACMDRVIHGAWGGYGQIAYPTDRTWRLDTLRLSNLGFRVVRTLP